MSTPDQNVIRIDTITCCACGLCGAVCPRHVTEVVEHGGQNKVVVVQDRVSLCLGCGHCVAICPTGSISVDSLDRETFTDLSRMDITNEQLMTLLRQRRSVRRYRQQPVPRVMIEQLIEAAHTAPTATGRLKTCLLVLDNRSRIDAMMKVVHEEYSRLEKAMRNPIARYIIHCRAGKEKLHFLDEFVMPGMRWYLKWFQEGKGDEISRDCPAMMIFHGPALEPGMNDNCTIAAFHSILMAETLGLGTCFNHLIPPIINRSNTLRRMLSIPEVNGAFTAVTLGFPKYTWKRAVSHRLAEVRFMDRDSRTGGKA